MVQLERIPLASLLPARCTIQGLTPYNQSTELSSWESALSGALAGGVRVLSLYPANTVKSAIQTPEELGPQISLPIPANKVGAF